MLAWRRVIALGVTSAAVIAAIWLLDVNALVRGLKAVPVTTWVLATALAIGQYLVLAARWVILNAPSGWALRIRYFVEALTAPLYNVLTPANLGADVYRIMVGRRRTGSWSRTSVLVLAERILGLSSYALLFLIGYALAGSPSGLPPFLANAAMPLTVVMGAPLLLLTLGRAVTRLVPVRFMAWAAITEAAAALPPRRVAAAYGLSVLSTGAWLVCLGTLSRGANVALDWSMLLMIGTITELSRLIPLSIQGAGIRESVFAWLATQAGAQAEPAFIACAAAYALHFAVLSAVAFATKFVMQYVSR